MRSRRIFTSLNSSKHVPIAKTRSHRFWSEYNLSKHVPVAKFWFVSFLKARIISVILWCYVLVFRGSEVSKRAEIDQEIVFHDMKQKSLLKWNYVPIPFGMIRICQNTFPLHLPLILTNYKWRKYCKKGFEKMVSLQKLHKKVPKDHA